MTMAELLSVSLLLPAALERAKLNVTHTAQGEPRARAEAELADLRTRWEAEAPARAARELAGKLGFRRSDYEQGVWIRKNKRTGRWDKFTAEQVAAEIAAGAR